MYGSWQTIARAVNVVCNPKNHLTYRRAVMDNKTRICELIGSIFFYGNFVAETPNERELETLLRQEGYFFETEGQLMDKLHGSLSNKENFLDNI